MMWRCVRSIADHSPHVPEERDTAHLAPARDITTEHHQEEDRGSMHGELQTQVTFRELMRAVHRERVCVCLCMRYERTLHQEDLVHLEQGGEVEVVARFTRLDVHNGFGLLHWPELNKTQLLPLQSPFVPENVEVTDKGALDQPSSHCTSCTEDRCCQ